jgi:hypothetical protein
LLGPGGLDAGRLGFGGDRFRGLNVSPMAVGGLVGSGAASDTACTDERGDEATVACEIGSAAGGGIGAARTASGL